MTDPTRLGTTLGSAAIADLNRLLQLDHDTIQAYGVAAQRITNVGRRETLNRFRADRERSTASLARLIGQYGGSPLDRASLAAGTFERAVRGVDASSGERELFAAFKASSRRSRDAFQGAAERADDYPSDLSELLRAAADDESRHYDWVREQLATLGVGTDGAARRIAGAAERVRSGLTGGLERLGAQGQRGAEAARHGIDAVRERIPDGPTERALLVGVAAAAVGFVLTVALASTLRRR